LLQRVLELLTERRYTISTLDGGRTKEVSVQIADVDSIRHVNLSDNAISQAGVQAIAEFLGAKPKLKREMLTRAEGQAAAEEHANMLLENQRRTPLADQNDSQVRSFLACSSRLLACSSRVLARSSRVLAC